MSAQRLKWNVANVFLYDFHPGKYYFEKNH